MPVIEAWKAAQVAASPERWSLALSPGDTDALRLGGSHAPPVHHTIARAALRSVLSGWGFLLVRGVVRAAEDPEVAEAILRALAPSLGRAMPQSPDGTVVGWLQDRPGSDWRLEQPMHTDGGDLLVLLCIRPAAVGGRTRLASARAVYDSLSGQHPDLLAELCRPWPFDRKGRPGPSTLQKCIFEWVDGELHCFHLPGTVRSTPAVHGLVPHTARENAALDALDAGLNDPELRFELGLEPGDLLLLDNRVVVHARSGYEDVSVEQRRLLLRMWWEVDRRAWRERLPG